ncbi:hypothetical protein KVR01_013252 [Diaporthe batatas]|uniref:uncharacterized protein n=1 Tax=Diaporthe batatas TaxID=748121 RepID=UPI001D0534A4|nr:uncharacterized protein KVR01_013252 [Diaporthe batatas]KAG8156839.1 hypothetical protein KVR01_013252 [Diaporthe batatas]
MSWFVRDIAILCLMLVVVAMRILSRVMARMPFWWDDWINFMAAGFCIGLTAATFGGMRPNGYGKEVWTLRPDQITEFLKSYYVACVMYLGARCLTRISLLLFYLRIFTVKECRRKIIYTLWAECIVSFAYFITTIFQCTPISFLWTKWDLEHSTSGYCVDIYNFMISGWSILVAADFWVLWLPLSMVAGLQLSMRKKLLASVMFATGIVVTAVGIVKLAKVYSATHTKNPTYELVSMNKYCQLEVDLGVICACMPSLPALFRCASDRLKGKRKRSMTHTTRASTNDSWFHRGVTGETKTSATTSAASDLGPPLHSTGYAVQEEEHVDPQPDQIQATTTIAQTYWRNDSFEMAGNDTDTEGRGIGQGPVTAQAWGDGPGPGSRGGHQRAQ